MVERDEGKEGVGEEEMEKKEARGERRWGGDNQTQTHNHTHTRTHTPGGVICKRIVTEEKVCMLLIHQGTVVLL